MSAVADPPIDTIVSQPARERMFAARRSELRLVLKTRYPERGPGGEQVGLKPGLTVAFRDGILRLPMEGKVLTEHGNEVDVSEIWPYIERHPRFGDGEEGFVEIAQVAPPASEEETTMIAELLGNADLEGLRAMLEREQAGWNRPVLTKPLGKAVETMERLQAQIEAQATEREAEAKKPRAK